MATRRGDLLDEPIYWVSPTDPVSIRDLAAGTLCCGMSSSGKTSGVHNTLLRGFLRAGMGGVLTTAKPDDVENIRRLCAEEGRLDSLIVWDGSNGGFNFLDHALVQPGPQSIENTIELLMRIIEMKRAASTLQGSDGDKFWSDSILKALRNTIPLLHAATGTIRVEDILRFVRSAPDSQAQMKDPAWQQQSFFCQTFMKAADRLEDVTGRNAVAHWHDDWCVLDPKTRGNILISLTTALDALNAGWLRRAFCEATTILPELCFEGAIIVLDMPALTRHEEGVFAQQIFVYAYQRAVLARNALPPRYRERPVCLIVDEFPLFCNSQYADFLGTCRSSRCCTVLLTQSLPALYARLGANAHDRAHHLVANCATKIWATNNCVTTNQWAADSIGKVLHRRASFNESEGSSTSYGATMGDGTNWGTNSSHNSNFGPKFASSASSVGRSDGGSDSWGRNRGGGANYGTSSGYSEQMDYLLAPDFFGRGLKTGGPANGNRVSAVWYQAGRRFGASGGTALLAEFVQ
jgi:hypothetical protein